MLTSVYLFVREQVSYIEVFNTKLAAWYLLSLTFVIIDLCRHWSLSYPLSKLSIHFTKNTHWFIFLLSLCWHWMEFVSKLLNVELSIYQIIAKTPKFICPLYLDCQTLTSQLLKGFLNRILITWFGHLACLLLLFSTQVLYFYIYSSLSPNIITSLLCTHWLEITPKFFQKYMPGQTATSSQAMLSFCFDADWLVLWWVPLWRIGFFQVLSYKLILIGTLQADQEKCQDWLNSWAQYIKQNSR